MSKKRQRMSTGPYVAVPKTIWEAPAWREMSPEARLLWIDLRGRLRNDGLNNGNVHRSCRAAAKSIGFHKDTITRRFAELEHYGFLRKTSKGFLGVDGRGIAAKYRFTDLAYNTQAPTRDFEKWDGELFVYTPRGGRNYARRPETRVSSEGPVCPTGRDIRKATGGGRNYVPSPDRKKQNPVLREETVRPTGRDIRKFPDGGSVCPTGRDIGSAPECPTGRDISRCQSLPVALDRVQGSSTVRAPAQAGGAGSSPAPVATPRLRRLYELSSDPRAMLEVSLCGPRGPLQHYAGEEPRL